MTRWLAALFLLIVFTPALQAQECAQSYSGWTQEVGEKGVYYFCTYTFEPTPGKVVSNTVVWYPTMADAGYLYYSNAKDKYWCRAIVRFQKSKEDAKASPRWNVISKDGDKKQRLNDIPGNAWGKPEHPICPGSNVDGRKGCPMKEPPPPPVAEYTSYYNMLKKK